MTLTVRLYGRLRDLLNSGTLAVHGRPGTVGQLIEILAQQHDPLIREELLDEEGNIDYSYAVFVQGRRALGLEAALENSDEVTITSMIGGGSGLAGQKLAHVDLSSGEVKTEQIPEDWRRRYIGGRGINMFLLRSRFPPPIEPLSPENPLIFGCGLLTGLPGFGSGRMNVTAYSPASGNLGDSNLGGHFGPELRFAGFDHLIITGRSPHPVYLFVNDGKIQIRDARDLWGQNTRETRLSLCRKLGDERVRVATIGPAGERLLRMANIMTGMKDAAGRFAMGAVMGSKNLKALVAKGTGGVPVARPQELLDYVHDQFERLRRLKWTQALATQGTPLLLAPANEGGWVTTRNDQGGPLGERGRAIYAETLAPFSNGMSSCFGCTVHCRHRHRVKGELPGEGPEFSALIFGGANLELLDPALIIRITDMLNTYGMDIVDTLTMISFAFELYQRGIISDELAGRPLLWGDGDAVVWLIHQMANRQGLGDILADGAYSLKRLPPEAAQYLIRIRNTPLAMSGGRVVKSFGMSVAVASIGGHFHRNRPGIDVLGLPPHVLERIYGGPVSSDFRSYQGKARAVWWHEVLYAVCDSLGFCRFQTVFNSPNAAQYPEYRDLLRLALDWDVTVEELREAGERIAATERLLLGDMGVGSREHDALPRRWLEEPVPSGPAAGEVIDRHEFQRFLDEFYALHGWDQDGRPTTETLTRLGVE